MIRNPIMRAANGVLAVLLLSASCRHDPPPSEIDTDITQTNTEVVTVDSLDVNILTNKFELLHLPSEVIYGIHNTLHLSALCHETTDDDAAFGCEVYSGDSVTVTSISEDGDLELHVDRQGESVLKISRGRYYCYFRILIKQPVAVRMEVDIQCNIYGFVNSAALKLSSPDAQFDCQYKICVSPLGGTYERETVSAENSMSLSGSPVQLIDCTSILKGYSTRELKSDGLMVRLFFSPLEDVIRPDFQLVNPNGIQTDFLWEKSISVIKEDSEPVYEYSDDIRLHGLPAAVKVNEKYNVSASFESWQQAEISIEADDDVIKSNSGNAVALYFLSAGQHRVHVEAHLSDKETLWKDFVTSARSEAYFRVIVDYKEGLPHEAKNIAVFLEYINNRNETVDANFSMTVLYGGKQICYVRKTLSDAPAQRILLCSYNDIASHITSVKDIEIRYSVELGSTLRYLHLDASHIRRFINANYPISCTTVINGIREDVFEESV